MLMFLEMSGKSGLMFSAFSCMCPLHIPVLCAIHKACFPSFWGGEKSFLSCAMVGKGQLPRVWNKEGIESLSTEFTPYYYQGPLFSPGLEQPNQCCLFLRTLKILWNRSSWFLVFSTDYLRFSFISSTNSVTTHHLQKFCSCCLLLFPLSL